MSLFSCYVASWSYTPICWHGWPLLHEWRGKEQLPHCLPELLSAWDTFLQGTKCRGIKMCLKRRHCSIQGITELKLWNSTCVSVRCIRIASSLDKQGCKAILIERGAVHHWCIIFKWIYWGVWRHSDVLQGQPQSCAALMVLEFQVKSNKMDRLHQVTYRITFRVELVSSNRVV